MGAVPAIGAGLSIVGGLASASKANASAAAQKKAIESQAQIDQLNSSLQLMALQNQSALSTMEDITTKAAEQQAYVARMSQLGLAEQQNSIALADAKTEARTTAAMSLAEQGTQNLAALQQLEQTRQGYSNALVEATGASTEEQTQVLNRLQAMKPGERAQAIQSIMDAAAGSGGTNSALALLTELVDTGSMGQVARAAELGTTKIGLAKNTASAGIGEAQANYGTALAQAGVEQANTQYGADRSLLDATTAEQVANAAFVSERTATEGAYNASQISGSISRQARDITNVANQEVVSRGAALSSATAAAQASAARGAGFFDYLSIGANGFTTYANLGGDTGFLSRGNK